MISEPELTCNRCYCAVYFERVEVLKEHVILCHLDLANSPDLNKHPIRPGGPYIYCEIYGIKGMVGIYSYKEKTLVVAYNSDGCEMTRFGGYDSDFRKILQMLKSWKNRIQNENDL